MKKLVLAVATLAATAAFTADAQASGCNGPLCQPQAPHNWKGLFVKQPLPAFQAAPWYLYWPYNAHFMTPAPIGGAYYAPPTAGGMFANPYFPSYQGYPGYQAYPGYGAPGCGPAGCPVR